MIVVKSDEEIYLSKMLVRTSIFVSWWIILCEGGSISSGELQWSKKNVQRSYSPWFLSIRTRLTTPLPLTGNLSHKTSRTCHLG